jgi:hypothetical protein
MRRRLALRMEWDGCLPTPKVRFRPGNLQLKRQSVLLTAKTPAALLLIVQYPTNLRTAPNVEKGTATNKMRSNCKPREICGYGCRVPSNQLPPHTHICVCVCVYPRRPRLLSLALGVVSRAREQVLKVAWSRGRQYPTWNGCCSSLTQAHSKEALDLVT